MSEVKDGDFVVFYIKDNKLLPIALTTEEHNMLQIMIPATLGNKISVLDEPQGEVKNLK